MRLRVAGAVIGGGLVPGDVEVEDGLITRAGISPGAPGASGYALPGLIDLQANGYGGVDFNEAGHDGFLTALRALKRDGVFAVQPTIITDSAENVMRQLKVIDAVRIDPAAACGTPIPPPPSFAWTAWPPGTKDGTPGATESVRQRRRGPRA